MFLRQEAAQIESGAGQLSKAERGERNLKREHVIKLAQFFKASEGEFVSLWLCGKVIEAVGENPLAKYGIKKALTKIKN